LRFLFVCLFVDAILFIGTVKRGKASPTV